MGIEENKLIADFLELGVLEGVGNNGEKYYYYNNAEMQDYEALPDFSHSWDDLIPVLEKIPTIKTIFGKFNYKIEFLNGESYCRIKSKSKIFMNSTHIYKTLLDATVATIIEFIEWFNHNR